MTQKLDPKVRQAAWARAQSIVLENAYALPFGSLTKVQAVRSNVKGFVPFRIPARLQRLVRQLTDSPLPPLDAPLRGGRLHQLIDCKHGEEVRDASTAWTGFGLAVAAACSAAASARRPFACPHKGGDFVFGQEANVNSLDQMTSSTISTRNVAMNIFETLVTRDENNNIIPDLADSITEAPDHLRYTFRLRPGAKFHNGKPAHLGRRGWPATTATTGSGSSAACSPRWPAGKRRTPATFVIRMKEVQPTFLDLLSSFSVPPVIVPAEFKDDPPQQLHLDRHRAVATGASSCPAATCKLKRFDGYAPNTHFEQRTGFGGYKQACFDTVTFRIVPEPGARVAGLQDRRTAGGGGRADQGGGGSQGATRTSPCCR